MAAIGKIDAVNVSIRKLHGYWLTKMAGVVSTLLRTFLFEHFSLVEELTTLTEQNTHFDTKLSVYFLQNKELTLNLANKCR